MMLRGTLQCIPCKYSVTLICHPYKGYIAKMPMSPFALAEGTLARFLGNVKDNIRNNDNAA